MTPNNDGQWEPMGMGTCLGAGFTLHFELANTFSGTETSPWALTYIKFYKHFILKQPSYLETTMADF